MNLKTKAAIAVLDAMYADMLSAVERGVTKLRELGEEDAAIELEDWKRQQRSLLELCRLCRGDDDCPYTDRCINGDCIEQGKR